MPRKLKVFRWSSFRSELRKKDSNHCQSEEICAAESQAEVARIAGEKGPWNLFGLSETYNEKQIEVAMKHPKQILFRGLHDFNGEWRKAKNAPNS